MLSMILSLVFKMKSRLFLVGGAKIGYFVGLVYKEAKIPPCIYGHEMEHVGKKS